jgi:hypothetical protein
VGVLLQKIFNLRFKIDIKLKDYILYKYKERIKENKDSLYYMLSIISSGNRGCCSSTVPIREPPLLRTLMISDQISLLCFTPSYSVPSSDCAPYNSSARTSRKTRSSVVKCAYIVPLPSNGYPITERLGHGNVFADSFPSNGSTCHNIILRIEVNVSEN